MSGEQPSLPMLMTQRMIGKLRSGVTLAQARAEMEALRQRMVEKFSGTNHRITSQVTRWSLIPERSRERLSLWTAVALPRSRIGIAYCMCINAGGLLFARGSMRRKELAVRMSVGASRWRIVRQLLAEAY